eukprot:24334-Chlamydomonas_euryale.AAC.2
MDEGVGSGRQGSMDEGVGSGRQGSMDEGLGSERQGKKDEGVGSGRQGKKDEGVGGWGMEYEWEGKMNERRGEGATYMRGVEATRTRCGVGTTYA